MVQFPGVQGSSVLYCSLPLKLNISRFLKLQHRLLGITPSSLNSPFHAPLLSLFMATTKGLLTLPITASLVMEQNTLLLTITTFGNVLNPTQSTFISYLLPSLQLIHSSSLFSLTAHRCSKG